MNVLFLSLLYHPDDIQQVATFSRDGLQNQINTYQWAFVDGLEQTLHTGESLSILNSLPVGAYPRHYRRLRLAGKTRQGGAYQEIGSLNLPWLKQRARAKRAERKIAAWVTASPENRTILVYSLYLPYMQAVAAIKARFPYVRATVIVTDLPNELGIASGRQGFAKWLEYRIGDQRTALCKAFDGFVLLTAPMADALPIGEQPTLVMEGLVTDAYAEPSDADRPESFQEDDRPAVLYTGTLNRELGIAELLSAFTCMPDVQLWLCGTGDMRPEIEQAAKANDNIRYFGFVPQKTALWLQSKADALINPRSSQGVFTRYSFPSKTLEYMRSGKPVLCCKLEGIPDEYDPYLRYIESQNAAGIEAAVRELLGMSVSERLAVGERARDFVLREKNSKAQCKKLVRFLREISQPSR